MARRGLLQAIADRRCLPVIIQTEATECALACLAMIARYHGHDIDLPNLRRRFVASLKGSDLARLIEVSHALGFDARPLRAELRYLRDAVRPCILHWDLNHFVVLSGVSRRGIDIHDPARGRYTVPLSEAGKHFTGVVLELVPGVDFSPVAARQRVSVRTLAGRVVGFRRTLVQLFGLAFLIELFSLVLPFQMQLILDQVILSHDASLLLALVSGFALIVTIVTGLSLARVWIISWLGATISSQWTANLFSHLLRLPLDYFQKRHIGDVISRFGSVQSVQNTLTGSFVEAILDGITGAAALVVLLLYNVPMTGVVLSAVCIYGGLRRAMFRALWQANEENLVYGSRLQSELMESVRGVQTIKLANKQSERNARMVNASVEAARRTFRSQRISLAFRVLNQGILGAQRVILIGVGAYFVLQRNFSVGMLVAYIAYADQFSLKFVSLVDKIVEFGILKLHGERIADIALADSERHAQGEYSGPDPEPAITINNVSFRYAEREPWVVRRLSMSISAGESVAVVGPSGCGKTTLAKLIVGLLEPTEGNIEMGGVDLQRLGFNRYRGFVSAVMQDDSLFAGGIAENIALFDEAARMEDIVEAATVAGIHEEIMAMPMAYESVVGDMGAALSGGQRQRIMLARAIYRKPKVLVLDEATSHLDSARESMINEAVSRMKITRIVIAHREATIASADRVISI